MCLYFPLNVADIADSKYHVEDVSKVLSNVEAQGLVKKKINSANKTNL
ncbi:MAG: hypothetical protein J1F68_00505 [Clostridiales bacterium]|nr:hypothetical protein [Clostridiales bacterium]